MLFLSGFGEYLFSWFIAHSGSLIFVGIAGLMAITWLGRRISLLFVKAAFGPRAAVFYDERLTAIGVIHHELAHLLLAILTFARIDRVCLYKIHQDDESDFLGCVGYTPRGFFLWRCLQRAIIGIAPAVLGCFSILLCASFMEHSYLSFSTWCLTRPSFWLSLFLMAEIAYHACPSSTDMRGSFISILVLFYLVATNRYIDVPADYVVSLLEAVSLAVAVSCVPAVLVSAVALAYRLVMSLVTRNVCSHASSTEPVFSNSNELPKHLKEGCERMASAAAFTAQKPPRF